MSDAAKRSDALIALQLMRGPSVDERNAKAVLELLERRRKVWVARDPDNGAPHVFESEASAIAVHPNAVEVDVLP